MALNRFHVVSPLALVAFSACRSPYLGEGGVVDGAVINGPLNQARVFLDYDFDGKWDEGIEPGTRTNQFGKYELTATGSLPYDLVAIADAQTVDTSSGATFSGITLKAPSGSGVISPTSTLMKEGGLTTTEVAAVLGLPDGVDPLSFNPFDVDANDPVAVTNALEVAKISKQITTAISSFASAAEGAGAGEGDAFTAALGSVVEVLKAKAEKIDDPTAAAADKELDFTNATDLALIKTEVSSKAAELNGVDTTVITEEFFNDTTAAIKNVNDKIETVEDLYADSTKNIFSTTQVLKDQVKEAASGTGTITFKESSNVETAAGNTAPSAITLSGDRLVSANGELVVGTVATIDPDPDDTEFTYTLAGEDTEFFEFNASSGELSLKSAPNYDDKPYYEITIITKDGGDKKFAETFIIDVVPEFGTLAEPDVTVVSDFDLILSQNTLFKKMNDFVELKMTADGQLVLVELDEFSEGGPGSSSEYEEDGPIIAFVNISERGYELRNPATNEYMGGFFTYEINGLTYTGYEVFVDDMSILAEYNDDLITYFSPDSSYGTGKLTYSDRDIEHVALAGAKAVDKDGVTVQEILGFNHFDEDMNVLGSAGVEVADPDAPYYIEVVGKYDPAVATNITATAIDAGIGQTMQTLLQTSGDEVLYGEVDEDGDYGNGGNVVEDGVVGGGNQGGDVSNDDDDDTLVIVNGDVYIIKTNEKLLVVKEIDGSYSIIPVADDVGKFGLGYDDMRQNQIGIALDAAGIEAVIGTTPNLDENILTQTSMYNDIVEQSGILPPDPVNGDIFNVSGDEWVLVTKTDVIFTLIPVKDHPGSSGQLIYDNTRVPMQDLSSADVELFLGYRPTLNENIASNTLEFASIKGAGSTGLVNGDVYIVNTDEKLLLVEESDGSYTLIPVADGAGDFTLEYDDTRQDQISTDLDAAGVEAVIGATQYLDENILLKTNMYNDIVQAFPRTPTFLGEVNLADPLGGDPKVSLKVAAVSEFTPGALIGELSYDDGSSDGGAELPIYTYSGGWTIYRSWDDMSTLDPGTYAMDAANDRVFEVTGSVEDGFNFTTGNSIPLAAGQSPGIGPYTNNDDFYTAIDHIKFPSSDNTKANIVFAISGQDLGFSVKGNEVYLNEDWFFNKGWGDNGTMVDASSGSGFGLGDISLSIAVSGDVSATAAIDVIGTNEKYFGLDGAEITAGGGYTFTPMSFNSFEFGDELGTITAASFDFDTVGLPDGDAWIEIVGNTVKLKDTAYYDVNTETFNVDTGGFLSLSELTAKNVTATKGDMDLVSAPILWSNMVDGGQIKQAPYWAGSPAGTKDLPIETNIKALMFEDQDGNGNPIGTTTYWVHDPSQDNSSVGDDIVITYSFVEDNSAKYIEGAGSSGGPNQSTVWSMNDAQKVSVRESLDAWSTVADITFVEVDESASDSLVGTMRFGFTTYKGDLENVAGWATGPGGGTGNGDVWITSTDDDAGVAQRAKDDLFQEGYSQGFLTLLHEIGHALGLAHPFEGYLMEGADPDTGEGAPLDHQKYTVMSYTVDDTVWFNGPAYPDMGYAISHTPMKEDIAAIQWMYGAQETNEDDTVYGSDYFDPETPFAMAIWDSGGVDTIDLSNFTEGCDLSLVSGTSSTVVCKTGGAGWSTGQMLNNLSIASGVIIENIITGSGDDTIVGNDADNLINGGAGADILTGGEGADIFEYNHLSGADRITDFVIGEDTLRFLDTNGDVITSAGDFDVSGIQDLAISYLGGELILEGLNSEHWDDAFLEIV